MAYRVPRRDRVLALSLFRWRVVGHEIVRIVGKRLPLLRAPPLRAGVPGIAEGDDVIDLDGLAQVPFDRVSGVRVMKDPVGHVASGPVLECDLQQVALNEIISPISANAGART